MSPAIVAHPPVYRRGVTLLEIVLAAAILAISLLAVSQSSSLGTRASLDAERSAISSEIARDFFNQLAAGITPVAATSSSHPLDRPGWDFTLTVEPVEPQLLRATLRLTFESNGRVVHAREYHRLLRRSIVDQQRVQGGRSA